MCVRKVSVRYRDRSTDNILKILEWLQKKGVRAWAFRDLFESSPTIYYIYKKDLSSVISLKFAEFYSSSESSTQFVSCVQSYITDNMVTFYADNKPYLINCPSQNIHPL